MKVYTWLLQGLLLSALAGIPISAADIVPVDLAASALSTAAELRIGPADSSDGSAGAAPSPSPSPSVTVTVPANTPANTLEPTPSPTLTPTPTITTTPVPTTAWAAPPIPTSAPTPIPVPTPNPSPSTDGNNAASTTTPSPTPTAQKTEEPAAGPPTPPTSEPTQVPSPKPTAHSTPLIQDPTRSPAPDSIPDAPESPSPPGSVQPPHNAAGSSSEATPTPVQTQLTEDPSSPPPPRSIDTVAVPTPTVIQPNAETRETALVPIVPLASPEIDLSAPTPTTVEVTVQNVGGETAAPPQPRLYQRGDSVIAVKKQMGNGTSVNVEVVVSPAAPPAVLARDVSTLTDENYSATKAKARGGIHSVLGLIMSLVAALSLLLSIIFHFVALQPTWTASMPILMGPNQWELLAFITYIQATASIAHYAVTAVPASLWQFLDDFSWTVFIPLHGSGSGIATVNSSSSRRLFETVVLNSLVAFADRIGVNEAYLLRSSAAGFIVLAGVVIPLVIAILLLVRYGHKIDGTKQPHDPFALDIFPRTLADETTQQDPKCQPFLVLRGFVVVLGLIAAYPLTMMASFEIASQARSGTMATTSLAIAVLALVLVPVSLTACGMSTLNSAVSEAEFQNEQRYRAVWGSLSSSQNVKHKRRVHFAAAWLAMQIVSAIVVGTMQSAAWQLALLLIVDTLFVTCVLVVRPFAEGHRLGAIFTVTVGVFKALTTTLALAFLSTSATSFAQRQSVATSMIAIISLVLALWFVRHLAVALQLLRLYRANQRRPTRGRHEEANRVDYASPSASTLFVALPSSRQAVL